MGKNEIRLRRKVLNPLDIDRHRDYSGLVKRYKRSKRYRWMGKFFTFTLVVAVAVLLLLLLISYFWFRVR